MSCDYRHCGMKARKAEAKREKRWRQTKAKDPPNPGKKTLYVCFPFKNYNNSHKHQRTIITTHVHTPKKKNKNRNTKEITNSRNPLVPKSRTPQLPKSQTPQIPNSRNPGGRQKRTSTAPQSLKKKTFFVFGSTKNINQMDPFCAAWRNIKQIGLIGHSAAKTNEPK